MMAETLYTMPVIQLHRVTFQGDKGYRVSINGIDTHLMVLQLSPPYWYVVAKHSDWDATDDSVYRSPGYASRREALDRAVYDHIHGAWGFNWDTGDWDNDSRPIGE